MLKKVFKFIVKGFVWLILTLITIIAAFFTFAHFYNPNGFDNAFEKKYTTFIEIEDNVKLQVIDSGGLGRPYIFIHGLALTASMFQYQYNALRQEGFRVIGITLRGFGKSSKPSTGYNYDTYADDINKIIKILRLENAVMTGYSMGSPIVIHYMARHNQEGVAKIALAASAAPIWVKNERYPYGVPIVFAESVLNFCNNFSDSLWIKLRNIMAPQKNNFTKIWPIWLGRMALQSHLPAVRGSLMEIILNDLTEEAKKITVPTIILHGRNDLLCNYRLAEDLNNLIPNSIIIPFEKGGHGIFLQQISKYCQELIKFGKN